MKFAFLSFHNTYKFTVTTAVTASDTVGGAAAHMATTAANYFKLLHYCCYISLSPFLLFYNKATINFQEPAFITGKNFAYSEKAAETEA